VYGSYVDEPLLRHAGTGTTLPTSGTAALYYHRNQQYSIVGLSDAAGTLVERYAYTAYGELTILAPNRTVRTTSSFQNRYTYTGREWDPTLRLYYFRARWLEPKAGRFIGRDPLGYVDGMGLYGAYFAIWGVDPMGLKGGHHWFPQSPRLQALLGKKCPLIPSILDFIHLFTTPMKGWGKGTLHDAIHHELKDGSYLGQVEKVYKNSKTCCELLKQMKDLILRVWLEANAIAYKGPSTSMPDLMPFDDDPWNTWQYLDEVIDVICSPKRPPGDRPPCPVPLPDPKRYPKPKPILPEPTKLPWMEPNGGYRQPPNYFPLPPMEWPGVPGPELTPGQKV
ncbi:MAG: RHS repeat domain-containing protein, partial [Planctomycetota bacterium]